MIGGSPGQVQCLLDFGSLLWWTRTLYLEFRRDWLVQESESIFARRAGCCDKLIEDDDF
jgi:hypothetical protein